MLFRRNIRGAEDTVFWLGHIHYLCKGGGGEGEGRGRIGKILKPPGEIFLKTKAA